jgi:hypothetical protein
MYKHKNITGYAILSKHHELYDVMEIEVYEKL